ncbi:MAG: hypothetical protein KGK03_09490 [Candidatus Omnitrophica bacterium]|nr:hypothetical protein [Candidatus Omnitrophota bacterium]MDE2223285.1 hypothetical protein [Candidatus Omnitrophota bacterium]
MSCHIENALASLQEAIDRKRSQMGRSHDFQWIAQTLFSGIRQQAETSKAKVSRTLQENRGRLQEFWSETQQGVRRDPWGLLLKAAAGGFFLGFLISLTLRRKLVRKKR